jgi:hypothetical protein
MSCKKQTAKKYLSRKSPPYSAMDCKGKTLEGKDGKYVSKPDKNKVYRWVKIGAASSSVTQKNLKIKIKSPKHKYVILDNGSHPYHVYDYGSRADVYAFRYDKDSNEEILLKKILSIPYKNIFPGDNSLKLPDHSSGKGNTVLIQQKNGKYIYIGDGIREFSGVDGDVIQKYYSPIGNSAVPYPYAVGKKYTYFLVNKTEYVENELLDLKKDGYTQLYGFSEKKSKMIKERTLFKRFTLYEGK